MNDLARSTLWLSIDLCRRALRERVVVVSMITPIVVTLVTLLGTILFFTLTHAALPIAVHPDIAPDTRQAMVTSSTELLVTTTPKDAVFSGEASLGTDGRTLWLASDDGETLRLEAQVRRALGASWSPALKGGVSLNPNTEKVSALLVMAIGVYFVLQGAVFGAGNLYRDREQGILDAERTLPLPTGLLAVSRLAASTALLSVVFGAGVLLYEAILGLADPFSLWGRTAIAIACTTALGLGVTALLPARTQFGTSLSLALSPTIALTSLGLSGHPSRALLPISSVFCDEPSWPLLMMWAVFLWLFATWRFKRSVEV